MKPDPRRDALVAELTTHEPVTPREARSLRITLSHLAWLPHPFDEAADPTHVTASAVVLDEAGHTLLHRHRRLGLWLQPGGHVDGVEAPAAAALREVVEETGLAGRHPPEGPRLVHVDVHEGGRGHLHLDLRYLVLAPAEPPRPPTGESQDVAWLTFDAALARSDGSFGDALRAAVD